MVETITAMLTLLARAAVLTIMKSLIHRPRGCSEVMYPIICNCHYLHFNAHIVCHNAHLMDTDSAKRDVIGQGHAIQRQPLSSVLGKILTRKDAVIMRYVNPVPGWLLCASAPRHHSNYTPAHMVMLTGLLL